MVPYWFCNRIRPPLLHIKKGYTIDRNIQLNNQFIYIYLFVYLFIFILYLFISIFYPPYISSTLCTCPLTGFVDVLGGFADPRTPPSCIALMSLLGRYLWVYRAKNERLIRLTSLSYLSANLFVGFTVETSLCCC